LGLVSSSYSKTSKTKFFKQTTKQNINIIIKPIRFRRHQTSTMRFAILLNAITALVMGSNAAVLPRQGIDNPRLAQFRVYSDTGCSNLNEGFFTVDTDQANQCNAFATEPKYSSLTLELLVNRGTACQRKCSSAR
jgi:hypothetical protein